MYFPKTSLMCKVPCKLGKCHWLLLMHLVISFLFAQIYMVFFVIIIFRVFCILSSVWHLGLARLLLSDFSTDIFPSSTRCMINRQLSKLKRS